jgi:DNA-binding CsgD family transcriptional regulator
MQRLGDELQRADLSAQASLARGSAARTRGEHTTARADLEAALATFQDLELPLYEARARRELALSEEGELALFHARAALTIFERLGARPDADETAAVLRGLGVAGRSAPRIGGPLTAREQEVLALLAEGLSNAAIADRLFISSKTAEHHVGRILGKLGLRSRAEAAAYALRNQG